MREVMIVGLVLAVLLVAGVCTPDEMRQEIHGVEENLSARIPTDFSLVIDKSGSMRLGSRFDEAQTAARNFVELLSGRDRVGIIAFDSRSQVLSEFSASKPQLLSSIDGMRIGDWTQYSQGLTASEQLYASRKTHPNYRKVIILMSDGRPDDNEEELFSLVDSMVSQGHCIFTIAYADDALEQAELTLQEIATRSQLATGCGEYFSAREDSFDLQRSYQSIYAQVSSEQVLSPTITVTTHEQVEIMLDITSTSTGQGLSACFTPESRIVILQNNRVIQDLNTQELSIHTSLPPGTYDYVVFVTESCDGGCFMTGEVEGSFSVDASSYVCTPTWNDLSVLLSRTDYSEVQITDQGFIPQSVRTDGVVIWKNQGSVPRQVIGTDGLFESPVLQPGDDWQYIFPPGSHGYREASGSFAGVMRYEPASSHEPVDMVLVLDNSGSMAGSAMQNAKDAAKNFIGILTSQDRAALVVFDHNAHIVQQLTSDKSQLTSAIDRIVPQGGTLYVPALTQALAAVRHSSAPNRAIIFLSDGVPHDLGGLDQIYGVLNRFTQVCLYTIGYAEEGLEAIETLNRMGEYARTINDCGSFYYSANDKEELGRVLGEVYAQTQEPRLEVFDVEVVDDGDGFLLSARVRSQENGARLPSESQFGCIPAASVRAVFGAQEFLMELDGDRYVTRVSLSPGTHSGFVTARITGFDSAVNAAFGFQTVEVSVPRSQWYLWVLLALGAAAIAYIFMRTPTRKQ